MKLNTKFTGSFDLNEVACVANSHIGDDQSVVINELQKKFCNFMTSYAPYTIVSDLASNSHFCEDGFSAEALAEEVDLTPTDLVGRIAKSTVLSEARAAFSLGFFADKYSKDLDDNAIRAVVDKIYLDIKSQSRRGLDSLARVLSYWYAKRALTLEMIHALGKLVSGVEHFVSLPLKVLVIAIALYKPTEEAVFNVLNALTLARHVVGRWSRRLQLDRESEVAQADSICKMILLCNQISLIRSADLEAGMQSEFGNLLGKFIFKVSHLRQLKYRLWLTLFFHKDKEELENVKTFTRDVLNVLTQHK